MSFMENHPGIRSAFRDSGLTAGRLMAMYDQVIAIYDSWAGPLPSTQLWKTRKPAHARECQKLAHEFAQTLGFSPVETHYFGLLFAAHDLGRMVQAVLNAGVELNADFVDEWREILTMKRPSPYPDDYHGKDSAQLLSIVLGPYAETQIGKWSLDAIRMHSFIGNPTLRNAGGSLDLLALANILRDLDKVEGFRAAKEYTGDTEFVAKQRLQNWSEQIKTDADWGTEMGRIDPPEFLDLFEQERAINRQQCRSYEAYMLQYLAWVFKIVQPEMLDVTLAEGGPQTVAKYLLRQLKDESVQQARLLTKLHAWRDGALLR